MSNTCSRSPMSAQIRPKLATIWAKVWPTLARVGPHNIGRCCPESGQSSTIRRCRPNIWAKFDTLRPTLADVGQRRPSLVNIGLKLFGRLGPKLAKAWLASTKICPTSASCSRAVPNVANISPSRDIRPTIKNSGQTWLDIGKIRSGFGHFLANSARNRLICGRGWPLEPSSKRSQTFRIDSLRIVLESR